MVLNISHSAYQPNIDWTSSAIAEHQVDMTSSFLPFATPLKFWNEPIFSFGVKFYQSVFIVLYWTCDYLCMLWWKYNASDENSGCMNGNIWLWRQTQFRQGDKYVIAVVPVIVMMTVGVTMSYDKETSWWHQHPHCWHNTVLAVTVLAQCHKNVCVLIYELININIGKTSQLFMVKLHGTQQVRAFNDKTESFYFCF